jgi:hypothetical protein
VPLFNPYDLSTDSITRFGDVVAYEDVVAYRDVVAYGGCDGSIG